MYLAEGRSTTSKSNRVTNLSSPGWCLSSWKILIITGNVLLRMVTIIMLSAVSSSNSFILLVFLYVLAIKCKLHSWVVYKIYLRKVMQRREKYKGKLVVSVLRANLILTLFLPCLLLEQAAFIHVVLWEQALCSVAPQMESGNGLGDWFLAWHEHTAAMY